MNTTEAIKAPEKLYGGVTAEQWLQWKKVYGEVTTIEVNSKTLGWVGCYIKPMDRSTLGAVLMHMDNKMKDMAGETALQSCWLGGDEFLRNPRTQPEEMASVAAGLKALVGIEIPSAQLTKN